MYSRNWEEWMFALTVAAAIVSVLALNGIRTPGFVSQAIAEERTSPDYTIIVTATRLPAGCRRAVDAAMSAQCDALRDATTTIVAKGVR